jgi:hypothetical protein
MMSLKRWVKMVLVSGLALQLAIATQFATAARAEMVTTDTAVSRYSTHADRGFLLSEIQKEEVRREIIAAGVDPAEAEARLRAMTDEEVAMLVRQIEDGSAGGDAFSTVIGALFTVFIILLLTDLLCLTNFFRFTRCAR